MSTESAVTLRPMVSIDWPAASVIYAQAISAGNATFEVQSPEWDYFDSTRLPQHRFVAESQGQILGWAAVSPVSSRAAYAGVVEHSIYIDAQARGRGLGGLLLGTLIKSTEAAGIWTIQASVFPDNISSLALHERHGFRIIGHRERIAQRADGAWQDTILIERRSRVVGNALLSGTAE